ESGAGYATGEYTIALPPSSPEAREAALTMGGSGLSSSRRPRVRTKLLEWELRFVREVGMSVPRLPAPLFAGLRQKVHGQMACQKIGSKTSQPKDRVLFIGTLKTQSTTQSVSFRVAPRARNQDSKSTTL